MFGRSYAHVLARFRPRRNGGEPQWAATEKATLVSRFRTRSRLRQLRIRISEPRDTSNVLSASVVLDLKFVYELAARMGRTSNPLHWPVIGRHRAGRSKEISRQSRTEQMTSGEPPRTDLVLEVRALPRSCRRRHPFGLNAPAIASSACATGPARYDPMGTIVAAGGSRRLVYAASATDRVFRDDLVSRFRSS